MSASEEQTFRHSPAMGEISGFSGGYESACQDMLEAGVRWLQERTKRDQQTDLQMHGYANVYGILVSDSDDAKALEKVVVAAAPGCSGAMHQAVMSRLGFIAKHGWEAYRKELIEDEAKAENAEGNITRPAR